MAAPFAPHPEPGRGGGALVSWAERTARPDRRPAGRGMVRFVFYGRVSTEDWQDPVTSRARQREQAEALVRGHGQIVADFFDVGQTRKLAWACRPQSGALVAQLADPDRGWDAVVIGGVRAGVLRQPVRGDGAAVRALRRAAVDAGGRRAGRLQIRA